MQTATPLPDYIHRLAPETLGEILSELPRVSLSQILQLSQFWRALATGTPHLWSYLDFGPNYTLDDLARALLWVERARARKLVVTIHVRAARAGEYGGLLPIFRTLSSFSAQIRDISIAAPDTASSAIFPFLANNHFTQLQTFSAGFESLMFSGRPNFGLDAAAPALQVVHTLPNLAVLHMANIPFFTTPHSRITELVLGPYRSQDMLSLDDITSMLQQIPLLSRLGFYRQMPSCPPLSLLLPATPITLPHLAHLSFRRINPDTLAHFVRRLTMPLFAELTLELHDGDLEDAETIEELAALLVDGSFTSRITVLNLHGLPTFDEEGAFLRQLHNVSTLRLSFFAGLPATFWDRIADPREGGPTLMPALQHLSLANVHPGHVQELISVRKGAGQPQLQTLELFFSTEPDVLEARSPAWSWWLSANVDCLAIPLHISSSSARLQPFGLF
ncbi:hypothetical protein C8R46DRAFT_1308970 [Mycena filopes]|nr:hypothetical protein C8R46DRAFT_1308970 [Mycena filopes]